jgi:hypothetical protein
LQCWSTGAQALARWRSSSAQCLSLSPSSPLSLHPSPCCHSQKHSCGRHGRRLSSKRADDLPHLNRQRQRQEQAARAAAVRQDAEQYRARMAEVREAATQRRSRLAEAMDDAVASGPVHMAPPPPVGIEFLVEQQIKAAVSRCVCARARSRVREQVVRAADRQPPHTNTHAV